ncbi:MAG TPA: hypothetical protein VFF67_09670 [Thermoplasmata archaeon]|nr:hypothetical protein [Thermoplasmata archaeon]
MVSLSPIRLAFSLPLAGYILARIGGSGLTWTAGAEFATVGFGFLAALPFVLPRRGRETWPYTIGVAGAAASTFAVAQYPYDPTNTSIVLASSLAVAGLVTFPVAAALWGALSRSSAGWQVFFVASSVVSTIVVVEAFHAVHALGNAASIEQLPWGVNSIGYSQAGALLGQVAGVGPPGAPPLSSALDPTFVAVALLSLGGAALSWAVPQTDRGVALPLGRPSDPEPPRGADDPALRFLDEEDRLRLARATAPSPPPLLAYPTLRPFVMAALVTVFFVSYALTAPQQVLFVLAVGATAAVAAVYGLGRPPFRRTTHPRTSAPR